MKGKFRRRVLSPLLLVLGIGLLGYVAHAYWNMYQEQKALSAAWEVQASALEHHAAAAGGSALPASRKARNVSSQEMLTRVVIPSIDLDAIVVEGVSRRQLAKGPGHMKDTPAPGERGNAVITGHRDTFFRHIHELNPGDDILIRRRGRVFRYQVTGKKIVWPQEVSVLDPTPDAELTLITCYPTYYIGPAPKRLVVFSKLVGTEADTPDQPAAAGASH